MRLSAILDFFLDIRPVKFPYVVPCYLIPEVFQWCEDNAHTDSLTYSTIREKGGILDYLLHSEKVIFSFNSKDDKVNWEFKEYMHKNRYKFRKKRFIYNKTFVWSNQKEMMHVTSKVDARSTVVSFYKKVLSINYLIGSENWCPGDFHSLTQYLFYMSTFSYMNFVYFFDDKDRMLYKLTGL